MSSAPSAPVVTQRRVTSVFVSKNARSLGPRIVGALNVAVAVGVGVSLPDGVGWMVGVAVGAGTLIFCPSKIWTLQLGPPVPRPKSHCENVTSGLSSESIRKVAPYLTAIMMMFSSFWMVCHVTPGCRVSVGISLTPGVIALEMVVELPVVWLLGSLLLSDGGVRFGSVVGVGHGTSIVCPCWMYVASFRLFKAMTVLMIGSRSRCPHRNRIEIRSSFGRTSWVHGP